MKTLLALATTAITLLLHANAVSSAKAQAVSCPW